MSSKLEDTDLNIRNYNLDDLVKLFKITPALSASERSRTKKVHVAMQKEAVAEPLKEVFSKGYIILEILADHRIYLSVTDPFHVQNPSHDETILEAVHTKEASDGMITDLYNRLKGTPTASIDAMSVVKRLVQPREQRPPPPPPPRADNPCSPTRFVNSFDSRFVKGNVNSMKRDVQLTNIHINSCFRDRYYDSNPCDYRYDLPNGTFQHVVSMKLASAEIPNAWFLFSHIKGNNKFIVEATHCGKCSVNHVIVPDGNYDRDSLVAYLNTKYFADTCDEKSPLKFIRICIEQATNRTKFELTDCAPADFVFSLHFTEDDTENMLETMGWILGFRLARYIKIQDAIQSEGLFDGGGDRYIYLSVNDYQYSQNSTNVVCFDKMAITDNILAKIPLINGKFSLTIDENDSNPLIKIRQYKGPVNISKLDIKLLDRFGNVINLNFMDWSFSLELEILYDNTLCS